MDEENELLLIILDDCQEMDKKDRKGGDKLFLYNVTYVLDT